MTRPRAEYDRAMELAREGMNDCQVARATGIPRGTIRDWRNGKVREINGAPKRNPTSWCPICEGRDLDEETYAYLLGLYLSDGCISESKRGVYKLRVALDLAYPGIIQECAQALRAVTGKPAVTFVKCIGYMEVVSYWKHWPCLFPQLGPGPKHLREIRLEPWQQGIVLRFVDRLLSGLIHSDGSRYLNRVRNRKGQSYAYPQYEFTNNSTDIQEIFRRACDLFGVRWRRMNWKSIVVSRRPDVAKLDTIIGPKS